MEAIETPPNSLPDVVETQAATPPLNLQTLGPALAVLAGTLLAFWPLMLRLPGLWFGDDTYYAHGVVVPICAGLIVWDRWDKLKVACKAGPWWALIPLAGLSYFTMIAAGNSTRILLSLLLIAMCLLGAFFITGWGGLRLLAAPIAYLAFCLPFWDNFIDRYTQTLQQISAKGAFHFFGALGMHPMRTDVTTIYLNNYTLDVGIACSGLKMVLAVFAIVMFFVLVAHLSWWRNLILFSTALPISVFVNTVRITLIGLVGNEWGAEAGHSFHDYSGYISLVICFLILLKLTKMLGWKS